jgi:hypothetical protein
MNLSLPRCVGVIFSVVCEEQNSDWGVVRAR